MSEPILQRCVFPVNSLPRSLYYRTQTSRGGASPALPCGRLAIRLAPGEILQTDTYLNTFFESYWRRFTSARQLALRLHLAGEGEVHVVRRGTSGSAQVLRHARFAGEDVRLVLDVPPPASGHEASALHFEIAAVSGTLLHRADWRAPEAESTPVRLTVGLCTYNREALLLTNLKALLSDPEVAGRVHQVIVVDQGTSRVGRHRLYHQLAAGAAGKFRLIEQENFGGAGGFTRALLEARRSGEATHVLLMDDDLILEPESVFRLGALFTLACGTVAIGGPMLDSRAPGTLAEAGTVLHPRWLRGSNPIHGRNVELADTLPAFFPPQRTHYNPWWFFGFPLRLVEQAGLPLPLFIRGDDAEFGCRLGRRGVRTVTVPGLAVWHEPFYLKKGGWHAYYDFRNMLILTAVHFSPSGLHVAVVFLRKLIHSLLCLNYWQAALACQALDDFCAGPGILEGNPQTIHQRLLAHQRAPGPHVSARMPALPRVQPAPAPASRLGIIRCLFRCIRKQVFGRDPTPGSPVTRVIAWEDAGWWSLGQVKAAGVIDPRADGIRVYYRSRRECGRLLLRGFQSLVRFFRRHRHVRQEWRAAFARLTSPAFWGAYLGLAEEPGNSQAGRRPAA